MDLSGFDNVLCDSKEALLWAYTCGLKKTSIVRTSSPALLCDNEPNFLHMADFWTLGRMKDFQSTIQGFSKDIFDAVSLLNDVSYEESISIAQAAVMYHQILYKAACLRDDDINQPLLVISVDGCGDPSRNNMNAPWDRLLGENSKLKSVCYKLTINNQYKENINNASFWRRIHLGGIETLLYRLVTNIPNKLNLFFNRHVLIASENELIIETASALAFKGVNINKIKPSTQKNTYCLEENYKKMIRRSLQAIVRKRIEKWVDPTLVSKCEDIFFEEIYKKLSRFFLFREKWRPVIEQYKNRKTVLLVNSPANPTYLALISICGEFKIPVITAQHGVTMEISGMHNEAYAMYEANTSDCFLAFNMQSKAASLNSGFSKAKVFVSGISARHLRAGKGVNYQSYNTPIVYVSTNLYKGNMGLFGTCLTDYDKYKNERDLIIKVLSKLPHKITYKTYPVDNYRYPDNDPIIDNVLNTNNIDLYDQKIDMRYLLDQYRVVIISSATSSLTWPILSGKPVIFINTKNKMSLTKEAHKALSASVFLFDDDDFDFYIKLHNFLSKPIEEIEELWKQKEGLRKKTIKQYFSYYRSGAGKRAAKIILQEYL